MPKSTKTPQSTTTKPRTRKPATTSAPPIAAASSIAATTAAPKLNHDEIAHRAYELFLSNGAMHGRDIDHWLQAESELRRRSTTNGR
jgi:hypothetical protein